MLFNTFPRSVPISQQQFTKIPREVSFTFSRADSIAGFWTNLNHTYTMLKFCNAKRIEAFIHANVDTANNYTYNEKGGEWIYPIIRGTRMKILKTHLNDNRPYTIDNLNPLAYNNKTQNYRTIEIDELAETLSKVKGNEIILYTGAGISKAGEVPVWTSSELKNRLGINLDNSIFTQKFFNNPDELVNTIKAFRNQLFADSTTLAHEAISELISLKSGIIIFTENYDLKHESSGSRVTACHMHTNPSAFSMVKLRAKSAKVLITIGLSQDDVAAISYIKNNNPNIKLISLTLSYKEIPKYIGETDYIITGDCQSILPQLLCLLKSKTKFGFLP